MVISIIVNIFFNNKRRLVDDSIVKDSIVGFKKGNKPKCEGDPFQIHIFFTPYLLFYQWLKLFYSSAFIVNLSFLLHNFFTQFHPIISTLLIASLYCMACLQINVAMIDKTSINSN